MYLYAPIIYTFRSVYKGKAILSACGGDVQSESLSLPLHITHMYVYVAQPFHILHFLINCVVSEL